MAKKKVDFNLMESTAEVAECYKGKILEGDNKKETMNTYVEAAKLLIEMETGSSEEDDISIAERKAKARKVEAEAREAEAKAGIEELNLANKRKDDKFNKAMDIVEKSAPYVTTGATIASTFVLFNKKCNFAEKSIKLITSIEHLGYIPAVTTKKVIDSVFSSIFKG